MTGSLREQLAALAWSGIPFGSNCPDLSGNPGVPAATSRLSFRLCDILLGYRWELVADVH